MRSDPGYLTYTELIARGWTDALLELLMPDPDRKFRDVKASMGVRSWVRMYAVERVERIEQAAATLSVRLCRTKKK
jgi:hypothetical protein